MDKTADKLVGYVATGAGHDLAYEDLLDLQIAGLNEKFQEQVGQIKLIAMRAKDGGITEIKTLADVVPLLLPHTAYKSYPESFVTEQRWDRLTKWLGTVTPYSTLNADLEGIEGIDEWGVRLERAGHFVSCSSGTTGKSAMLVASKADLEFAALDGINAIEWGSAIRRGDRRVAAGSGGAVAYTPRNAAMGQAMMAAFVDPEKPRPTNRVAPITIGSIARMIGLRKAIAEGLAKPEQIAEYEAESAARQSALDEAREIAIEEVIARRGEKLFLTGMWASLYALAEGVRSRGYSAKDFHPENAIYLGGGLKRAQLPDNYREYVYETFNLSPAYIFQMYGMQEINTTMPRCQEGGRYHVPPWLVAIPLNKEGDQLVDISSGEVEARAAFFDLSMDGRWGGVISGDRINIDFSPCACGAKSPSIRDDVVRYADLEGDDKIGCSGTVDAYVRGLS